MLDARVPTSSDYLDVYVEFVNFDQVMFTSMRELALSSKARVRVLDIPPPEPCTPPLSSLN